MAQGFAHDLAGVRVSAGSNFMSDEALQVFCQCHLHDRIFPRDPPHVNADGEDYQPARVNMRDQLAVRLERPHILREPVVNGVPESLAALLVRRSYSSRVGHGSV